jgi:hypothetical protein
MVRIIAVDNNPQAKYEGRFFLSHMKLFSIHATAFLHFHPSILHKQRKFSTFL